MTWTVPEVDRPEPPGIGAERAMVQTWLDHHRMTLLRKCEGLDAEQLRLRSAEPSELSLLGLIRHLTDVERTWFRKRVCGEDVPDLYWTEADQDADFHAVADADAAAAVAVFREEIAACDKAVAELALDHTFVHPRTGETMSLRWVYLHMIEEYARHNGHADLLRERIDGVTGE
ncbi:DinB family protein [Nocardia sp. CDC159]|uniref:DinB family protein n=1 Tax=Nocardia pulmonis TaxID=2951408 RepID=A0A9X2E6I9_9NOCA|nr:MULTISPECIES: DinB family protein [Nocardia]MCM6773730.1 DinB family protein [Nocardia pulmonis]MCM6786617.1 DinB family protein [Nocardia sp. CDC159]